MAHVRHIGFVVTSTCCIRDLKFFNFELLIIFNYFLIN